jgi:DNA-binding NarL/FixJ family response regulator
MGGMNAPPAYRVVLADDHPIVLDGLESLFRLEPEFEVVARCRDGVAVLEAVAAERPDLVILDVRMPRLDGLGVLRRLAGEEPRPRVLLLTAALDDGEVVEAVRLGVRGVVLKEMAPRLLVEAARQVAAGGEWLDQGLGGRLLRRVLDGSDERRDLERKLTARELEIIRGVSRGLRNSEIANELHIAEGTVKIHLHNVYEKLSLRGRVELALFAKERGIE